MSQKKFNKLQSGFLIMNPLNMNNRLLKMNRFFGPKGFIISDPDFNRIRNEFV